MGLNVYLLASCAKCGGCDQCGADVFEAHFTRNLISMAAEAGVYDPIWRPGEMLDPEKAARIREQELARNYDGPGGVYEIERSLPVAHARDLIAPITAGLALLRSDPERFKAFNPENGFGSYDSFVHSIEKYLQACMEYQDAKVRVSR